MGLISDDVLWSKLDVCFALAVLLLAAPVMWVALVATLWRPLCIKRAFESQGIPCLPFRFLLGNLLEIGALHKGARHRPMPHISHDIAPRIIPEFYHWPKKYGDPYVYWFGFEAYVNLTNVEDAKEVLSAKSGPHPKPQRPELVELIGNGLAFLEGEKWSQHRRIMNPAFFMEKLKAMVPAMAACSTAAVDKWGTLIEEGRAIDVHKEFKDLTADIIAHTAFGSSYVEGRQVFELQAKQQIRAVQILTTIGIPGARYLPTAANWSSWKTNRTTKRCLRQMIQSRLKTTEIGHGDLYGNDLLGLMMAANKGEAQGNQKNLTMSVDEIIDECKTIFFGGHDTTASLLAWTALLLATNPSWQDRTREEVYAICGRNETPTADSLSHLKIMGMVVNESMRLYPPLTVLYRRAAMDMEVGKIRIPKDTVLTLPIIYWHHDEQYWGPNVNEFHPERFSEGVAKASKVLGAFLPFSTGPHVCIGQSYVMLEAKVVLSTILQRYRLHLCPAYQHSPTPFITLQPQFGMPIIFEKLS